MARLLIVVGLIWAIVGVGNIVLMPWATMDPAAPLASFGIVFNMMAFVLPGLVVAGIGSAIGKHTQGAQPEGATASDPRSGTRACPSCAEIVKSEAKICRFCGRDLPPDPGIAAAATTEANELAAIRANTTKWERRWRRILHR